MRKTTSCTQASSSNLRGGRDQHLDKPSVAYYNTRRWSDRGCSAVGARFPRTEEAGGSNPPSSTRVCSAGEPLQHRLSGRSAVWLAHLLWEQGVEGSNPFAPTSGTGAGIAQLARAMAFQAVGRGFESRFPLQITGACSSVGQSNGLLSRGSRVRILPGAPVENVVSVVQSVRALDCGSRSWGFESPRSPQYSMSARSSVDRVTDFGSVGRGFESCRARQMNNVDC